MYPFDFFTQLSERTVGRFRWWLSSTKNAGMSVPEYGISEASSHLPTHFTQDNNLFFSSFTRPPPVKGNDLKLGHSGTGSELIFLIKSPRVQPTKESSVISCRARMVSQTMRCMGMGSSDELLAAGEQFRNYRMKWLSCASASFLSSRTHWYAHRFENDHWA